MKINPYAVEALNALLRLDHHRHQVIHDAVRRLNQHPSPAIKGLGALLEARKKSADFKYDGEFAVAYPLIFLMHIEALVILNRTMAQYPDNLSVRLEHALTHLRSDNPMMAMHSFEEARSLDGQVITYMDKYATLLKSQGKGTALNR